MQTSGIVAAATKSPATTPATSGDANSFRLSPLRTNISISPGQSGQVPVSITNLTKATAILQPIENDFVAGNETGQPALIIDPNSYAPTHSLKRFMVPMQNITLAPGQSQTVTVTIRVPKTAQAGGYFGALRFAPANVSGPAVAVGSSVASLILLTVPGPTVEQLTLTDFAVEQNGGVATNFRTPKDLSLFLRFENKGNLQEAPFGQIYVQKGKKVLYKYNFNQENPAAQILPDSARRWMVPLKGLGKFGKYTVGGTFTYGAKGQTVDIVKTVWIIPTIYILVVVGIVAFLVAIIGGIWLFVRSYKRKILRSSRRRY
ncbi:MAG TPA: hypothetical protein VLF69_03870 [Candidatus Saccharimonadales bacterium]|nr:hypothetical protein [Candidatus Saccharimonadales bacterium]